MSRSRPRSGRKYWDDDYNDYEEKQNRRKRFQKRRARKKMKLFKRYNPDKEITNN